MGLSKESKIKEIMANEAAVALMESYIPGISKDPKLKMAMGMSLEKAAKMAPKMVKPEWIDDIDAKLKALGD